MYTNTLKIRTQTNSIYRENILLLNVVLNLGIFFFQHFVENVPIITKFFFQLLNNQRNPGAKKRSFYSNFLCRTRIKVKLSTCFADEKK